ncbi:MAG: hypothetical protein EOP58_10250, partial [Sphingomonadales bacterium]
MKSRNHLIASLSRSAAPLALALGLMAAPAFAQDAAAQDAPEAQTAAAEQDPGIVVTGSLFRRTDTETPSPVTVLTAESLAAAGITTAADA